MTFNAQCLQRRLFSGKNKKKYHQFIICYTLNVLLAYNERKRCLLTFPLLTKLQCQDNKLEYAVLLSVCLFKFERLAGIVEKKITQNYGEKDNMKIE